MGETVVERRQKKMVLSKYKLPNGNVFIWLGGGGIRGKSEGIDNILVLEGGDILILKTISTIPLWEDEVREDLKNLSYDEFVKKYELPANRDLWKELKEGVSKKKYPPFRQSSEQRMKDFRAMISAYITNILQLRDPSEKIRQLEEIIEECHAKLLGMRTTLSK